MKFAMALVVAFGVIAQAPVAKAADIVSLKGDRAVRVRTTTLENKKIRFELCKGTSAAAECSPIGSESGYSRASILDKLQALAEDSRKSSLTNMGIIVGSIVVGGVYGLAKDPGPAGGNFDFSPLVRIWNGGKFTILGGIAGTGVVVVKNLLSDDLGDAQDALISGSRAGDAEADLVFVTPVSISDFVKSLNIALMYTH